MSRPHVVKHGTLNEYKNFGCRCEACREANRVYHQEYAHRTGRYLPWEVYVAQAKSTAEARENHGTESRYTAGCRCAECRDAMTVARRKRRHANAEATRAYDRAYKRRRRGQRVAV